MTDEFTRDPSVIFTTDLNMGKYQMRESLSLAIAPNFEASELEYLGDVIYEFCEELSANLLNYRHEMIVLHEMDVLYWRRRTLFQNENITSIREFLLQQFYESLPTYPTHCINLVLVHDLRHLTPYFYLKRPVPSLKAIRSMLGLLRTEKINKGDSLYVMLQSWLDDWSSSEQPSSLQPIDSSVYVDTSRMDSINCDGPMFVDVPEWAWQHLLAWYGITNCHLGLKRIAIESQYNSDMEVERTPEDIWCFLFPNNNEFRIIRALSKENLTETTRKIKHIYNIPTRSEARLYTNTHMSNETWNLLDELTKSDKESICKLMLVLRRENGDWPDVQKELEYYF